MNPSIRFASPLTPGNDMEHFHKNRKTGILYHVLSAVILTYLLRMALPEARYVSYPLYLVVAGYFLFDARDRYRLGRIFKSLAFYLVLLAIVLTAAVYRAPFIRPWAEVFNGLGLAFLLLILFYYVRGKDATRRFRGVFSFQLFIFSVIIGLVGLGRGLWAWAGGGGSLAEGESIIAAGSDYNFYILTILYGLVIGIYHIISNDRLRPASLILYNGSLIILAANVLLVPSRRGIVVFVVILIFLLLVRQWILFRRIPKLSGISRVDPFLLFILGMLLGGHLLLFETSPGFKKKVLVRSGLYRLDVRERVTDLYCRYGGMVDKDIDFREVYHRLWNPRGSHPGDSRSGKTRAEVHPILATSFFQDGKALFNAKAETQVRSFNEKGGKDKEYVVIATSSSEGGIEREFYVDVGDTIEVSVWLQVLKWSRHLGIRMPGPDNREIRTADVPKAWEGDGRWHQLRLKVGYDVFGSLPLRIGGGGPERVSLSCWGAIRVENRRGQAEAAGMDEEEDKPLLPVITGDQIRRWMAMQPSMEEGARERRLSGNSSGSLSAGMPGFLKSLLVQAGDGTDMEALADGFDPNQDRDSRPARWRLARVIYRNYTPAQKMTGAGFSYLPVYGRIFYDSTQKYDYPHNPLISAFLYSGWIGGICYMAYLVAALFLYIRYLKKEALFFVLMLLTGLFVSISGNSHFSVPAFAFFAQWPFFIHLIYRSAPVKKMNDPA